MATAIDFRPARAFTRPQSTGWAGGSASAMRVVSEQALGQVHNGCEVVLSPAEYNAFREMLNEPPQVIPGFAALLRARRNR